MTLKSLGAACRPDNLPFFKKAAGLLLVLLPALLCACSGAQGLAEVTPEQLAQAVLDSQPESQRLTAVAEEEQSFYLTDVYGIEEGHWTGAALYVSSGVDAREVVVIRPAEASHGKAIAAALGEYRRSRQSAFFGYAPEQAALLEKAAVLEQGGYVALLVCEDIAAAQEAFRVCLREGALPPAASDSSSKRPLVSSAPSSEQPPELSEPSSEQPSEPVSSLPDPPSEAPSELSEPTTAPALDISGFAPFDPPNEFDMTIYDNSAVLAAWESGDDSSLSDKEKAILRRCREIFDLCITENMTDLEKELALHDFVVKWGSYDQSIYDPQTPQGQPDNNNPYGFLIEGQGICLGYATTFQLLMELAGIECVTVVGAAFGSTRDHAWNMVRLEGEWYCVDSTWNDPAGGGERDMFVYFNVTSDYMRDTDHQWDYLNIPEATADRFHWNGTGPLPQ